MNKFEQMYQDRINARKASVEQSELYEDAQIRKLSNQKIDEIRSKVEAIAGKRVWTDFSYKTGKITGLLRFIFFNYELRDQLLEATGLDKADLDMYFEYVGNMPFVDQQGNVNTGRAMNIEKTKELIMFVADKLGVLVEERDLDDFNEANIQRLYERAMTQALDTKEFTESGNTSDTPKIYEE